MVVLGRLKMAGSITVTLTAVDGWRSSRAFHTVEKASAFARKHLGDHPEMGYGVAVSQDGVVTCSVKGACLDFLFPAPSFDDGSAAELAAENAYEADNDAWASREDAMERQAMTFFGVEVE